MKERPILFSAPMVCAILEGRKTQTRRVWKMPSWAEWDLQEGGESAGMIIPKDPAKKGWYSVDEVACPYGWIGDGLWVRETFFCATGEPGPPACYYRASDDCPEFRSLWKPSIHMPRWASRIQLEIIGVRVERLQDIGEADSIAEGVDGQMAAAAVGKAPSRHELLPAAVHGYAHLWESINGPGSWDANPWVWVVEFRRIKP